MESSTSNLIIAICSIFATVFAAAGFFQLIWQTIDNRRKIIDLSEIVKELQNQNKLNDEKIKLGAMPQMVFILPIRQEEAMRDLKKNGWKAILNNSGSPAYDFRFGELENDEGLYFSHCTSIAYFDIESREIKVDVDVDYKDFKGMTLWMSYRDWLHNWYKQKVEIPWSFPDYKNYPPIRVHEKDRLRFPSEDA